MHVEEQIQVSLPPYLIFMGHSCSYVTFDTMHRPQLVEVRLAADPKGWKSLERKSSLKKINGLLIET